MTDGFIRQDAADLTKKIATEILVIGGLEVHRIRTLSDNANYTVLLEDLGSGVVYVGKAVPGTAKSDAAWQLRKLYTVGGTLEVLWADGEETFTKVWNNRASYSYET